MVGGSQPECELRWGAVAGFGCALSASVTLGRLIEQMFDDWREIP